MIGLMMVMVYSMFIRNKAYNEQDMYWYRMGGDNFDSDI